MASSNHKNRKSSAEGVQADLSDLIQDLTDITQRLAEAKGVDKDTLQSMTAEAKRRLEEVKTQLNSARQTSQDLIAKSQKFIEEKPVESAFIAFGIGYVLGNLFRRR